LATDKYLISLQPVT